MDEFGLDKFLPIQPSGEVDDSKGVLACNFIDTTHPKYSTSWNAPDANPIPIEERYWMPGLSVSGMRHVVGTSTDPNSCGRLCRSWCSIRRAIANGGVEVP